MADSPNSGPSVPERRPPRIHTTIWSPVFQIPSISRRILSAGILPRTPYLNFWSTVLPSASDDDADILNPVLHDQESTPGPLQRASRSRRSLLDYFVQSDRPTPRPSLAVNLSAPSSESGNSSAVGWSAKQTPYSKRSRGYSKRHRLASLRDVERLELSKGSPTFRTPNLTPKTLMDAAARAAGIVDAADPSAHPSRDVELGHHYRNNSETASRVSLPLSHQRSFSIATSRRRGDSIGDGRAPSTTGGDGQEYEEPTAQEGGMEWGPSHPCFPHMNPHVPVNSHRYETTRVIRIRRDWMQVGDLAPTFSLLYPEILEPVLSEERFRNLIKHINAELIRIYNPWAKRAWFDAGMGLMTGWLWDDLGLSAGTRDMAKLEDWIERWNFDHGRAQDVTITSLRRTAFLSLDIQIPDPQISADMPEPTEDGKSVDVAPAKAGAGHAAGKGSKPISIYSSQTSVARPTDDKAYGAYPVPPIQGKYFEEAQQQVEKQTQGQRAQTEG